MPIVSKIIERPRNTIKNIIMGNEASVHFADIIYQKLMTDYIKE